MLLSNLFRDLSYSELANLPMSGNGMGNIPDAHHARLLTLVNQGLLDLYGRFKLLEKAVYVETVMGLTLYYLRPEHARTNTTVGPTKYIIDGPENPFIGDVIKILEVYDEVGEPLSLNNALDPDSLFTAGFDCLQIPDAVPAVGYRLIYQARHPELVISTTSGLDLSQEIRLPLALEGALRAWIGHKVFSSMTGPEHLSKAQELLAYYEMTCQQTEKGDLYQAAETWSQDRFSRAGWI